ncbi:uncharacterized protein PHALS_01829 [Plasmopara halstedii]|uniref:Uncharacterized protein n=1 Tax=Plasmopara halstedii TaxID=4781 RepID=A0A0P1AWJ1_PLAHL|nr:uncharacterized protein PHALS_01829 [Plasmopara halstedii]CEG45540.1 hypothetical protein PHALS_01829 [Plasmopara halstedii]|eukprot:XP_024581909.1 hypothetical protein PHALS_01829 [Plasmopara halstedii]
MHRLPLNNPTGIEELLSLVMEDDTADLELNDDEIITMAQKAEVEENDDQEKDDVEKQIVTNLEKLSLAITASLLEETNPTDGVVLRRIRELQKSLKTTAIVQTTTSSWLVSNESNLIAWHFIVFYVNKIHVYKKC